MNARMFSYILLPPVGTDRLKREGKLVSLVLDIPSLLFSDYVPPIGVLNQILLTGRRDAGMSGGAEWEPFKIGQDDYSELVSDLKKVQGRNFHFDDPPEKMTDFELWWRWVLTQPR